MSVFVRASNPYECQVHVIHVIASVIAANVHVIVGLSKNYMHVSSRIHNNLVFMEAHRERLLLLLPEA